MRRLGLLLMCASIASCTQVWRWEDGGTRPGRTTAAAAPSKPRRVNEVPSQYTVKRGDTLYSISIRHGLDYHDVAAWNGIDSQYRIDVGQVLRLSPPGAAPSKPRDKPAPVARAPSATPAIVAPRAKPDVASAAIERYYQWQWPLRGSIAKAYSADGGSKGLDIGGELGQTVIAAAPGRVVYSGSGLRGYGELVIIKHDETYLSAYGYNRKRLVEEGDLVTAGQAIAELGLGPEQKPVLHFEIREHGRPLDPLPLLPKIAD